MQTTFTAHVQRSHLIPVQY